MKPSQLIATGLLLVLANGLQAQNVVDPVAAGKASAKPPVSAPAPDSLDDEKAKAPDFEPRIMPTSPHPTMWMC